jgi:hypothetical protein
LIARLPAAADIKLTGGGGGPSAYLCKNGDNELDIRLRRAPVLRNIARLLKITMIFITLVGATIFYYYTFGKHLDLLPA